MGQPAFVDVFCPISIGPTSSLSLVHSLMMGARIIALSTLRRWMLISSWRHARSTPQPLHTHGVGIVHLVLEQRLLLAQLGELLDADSLCRPAELLELLLQA